MAGLLDVITNGADELPEYVVNFTYNGTGGEVGYQLWCFGTLAADAEAAFFADLKSGLAADGNVSGVSIQKIAPSTTTL